VPATAPGRTPAWSFVPLSQSTNFLSRSAIHLLAGPGQVVSDTAVLTNYSTDELHFDVYGSDAYNTKSLGAFTLNPPNVKPTGVGSWITLPVNEYDLKPCSVAEFHFEVKVPLNAAPGDHAGGIVALNLAGPTAPQPGTNFAVQRGEGVAVYVRVPGPLHPGVAAANVGATYSSSPLGFGSSWARVHFQVVNTGNEVLNGKVQATVTDIFGSTVHTFRPVAMVALIPGGRMTVAEPQFSGLPFFGPVHLNVKMSTNAVKSTGEAQFWIVPWLLILIIVLVLGALFYLWRRRRKGKQGAEAEEDAPEDAAKAGAPGVEAAPVS
jgi:LPXTG-motif cell wall-anchored protein